jgi:hypothetical protein
MSLANAIQVHRISGLSASLLSLAASFVFALTPQGWDTSSFRALCLQFSGLLFLGALFSGLVSVICVMVIVAIAPHGIGVGHRFALAVLAAVGAIGTLILGIGGRDDPGVGTVLVAGVLMLVSLIEMAQVWTALARFSSNDQLAEDLRNSFLVAITGAILHRLASSSGEPVVMLAGIVALIPGTIMGFKALGALVQQFQTGAAWET